MDGRDRDNIKQDVLLWAFSSPTQDKSCRGQVMNRSQLEGPEINGRLHHSLARNYRGDHEERMALYLGGKQHR